MRAVVLLAVAFLVGGCVSAGASASPSTSFDDGFRSQRPTLPAHVTSSPPDQFTACLWAGDAAATVVLQVWSDAGHLDQAAAACGTGGTGGIVQTFPSRFGGYWHAVSRLPVLTLRCTWSSVDGVHEVIWDDNVGVTGRLICRAFAP